MLKKSAYRHLAMISQLAISVLTPILLCTYLGYKLDNYLDSRWFTLTFLVLGTLSGGNLAYRLAKNMLEKEIEEDKKIEAENKKENKKINTIKPKRKSKIFGKEIDSIEKK